MIIHQHIKTRLGEIWILNSTQNGFERSENETRQQLEGRVMNQLTLNTIGEKNVNHHLNGAPYFKNRPELKVSISHSNNWFALYITSTSSIGIDIEVSTRNIGKIKAHFLSQIEIDRLQPNKEQLQICWGIKESIYKFFQGDILSFKQDIEILIFKDKQAIVRVKNQEITLNFLQFEDFTLVYTN